MPKDYTAALNYLKLQFSVAAAQRLVKKARGVQPTEHIAKDILRASNLSLLPLDEPHVAENLKRIGKGKALSPVILVQGDLTRQRPFVIVDGIPIACARPAVSMRTRQVRAILVAP